MFRALAEFILRGRIQAIVATLFGNLFPFIGPSAIALVSLARGTTQSFWVFMWVSLPLMLLHYLNADNPLLIAISISSLGLMVVLGAVHQVLASWQWTILAALTTSVLVAFSISFLMAASINNLMEQIIVFLEEFSAMQGKTLQGATLSKSAMLGFVAMGLSLGSVISMMIARWWQSLIYNPGGFQEEFHKFTIESKTTVVLVGVTLLGMLLPKESIYWITLPTIPLLFSGIALLHFSVKHFQLGGHWLVLFYLSPLLFGALVALLLMSLAIGDSFLDIRGRLLKYKNR